MQPCSCPASSLTLSTQVAMFDMMYTHESNATNVREACKFAISTVVRTEVSCTTTFQDSCLLKTTKCAIKAPAAAL